MAGNPHITLIQLEQALNNFQNTAVNEEGTVALTKEWLEMFDNLLKQLIENREMLDVISHQPITAYSWGELVKLLHT